MKLKKWICAALPVILWGQAEAAEINLRGFASLVGGTTLSSDDVLYEYEGDLNFRNDSLMALQVDAVLDEKLSATMQFMSRGANGYEPVVEWAYLSYKVSDKLQVNGGRIRIPFYRYSDFIDVRYTYNWIKVPETVYGFEFPGYDGLSLVYSDQFGRWDSTLQFIYGQLEGDLNGVELIIEDLAGFSWTLNRDWLTLRAGYVKSKTTITIAAVDQLATGVIALGTAVGQDLSWLANDLRVDTDPGYFGGVAMGIDYNNILFDVEFIQYELEDSLVAATDAYYLSLGYRFGKWIPMVTYSESSSDSPDDLVGRIPTAVANLPFGPATLGQVIAGAVAATETETTLTEVGLRYDFHHSAAFKIAFTQAEDTPGTKNNLLRFAVDLVF